MKSKIVLPPKDEIVKAMEVADTPEAAEYLKDRFKEKLVKAKMLDKLQDIMSSVENFVQYIKYKFMSGDPWSGTDITSDFKNTQKHLANDAIQKLMDGSVSEVRLDIAINDQAQLLRGYSSEGKELPPKEVDALDKLFNAWLAEKNIVVKDSTFYESHDNGEIKIDEQGKQIKANAEKIRQLINDQREGFEPYLAKEKVHLTTYQQEYPGVQSKAEQQRTVEAAVKTGTGVKDEERIEPQKPSL